MEAEAFVRRLHAHPFRDTVLIPQTVTPMVEGRDCCAGLRLPKGMSPVVHTVRRTRRLPGVRKD